MVKILPTLKCINDCQKESKWDHGNKELYKLCRKYPTHKTDTEILTKVLFIGRIYAAAVERRVIKDNLTNEEFYLTRVTPTFKILGLDKAIARLSHFKIINYEHVSEILMLHNLLTKGLENITKLEKRSFSSKYLHFHLPNLFFIYDTRAIKSIGKYKITLSKAEREAIASTPVDKSYAIFYYKCIKLQQRIYSAYKIKLSPREIDRLLLNN
jgi:hypothetical protein